MGHAPTLVALTSSASSSPISFPLDPPTNLHSYASHLDIWTIDSLPGGLGDSKIPPTLSHQQLFAKHMKVAEQVEYLKQTAVSVAIGTPDRLGKLLSAEGWRLLLFPPLSELTSSDLARASLSLQMDSS